MEKRSIRSTTYRNGFTLLEVILALSIMSMIVGGIFAITQSILSLSQSSLANQNTQRHTAVLEDYFSTLFKNLPRNLVTELRQDDLNHPLLNIYNPGTFYPSTNKDQLATYLNLRIIKNRDGLLSLQASWSSQDLSKQTSDNELPEIDQTLTLIDNLTAFEWEIYSIQDQEWYPTWSSNLPRPSHIRMTYSTAEDQHTHTHTFWIPPRR